MKLTLILCALALVTVANAANLRTSEAGNRGLGGGLGMGGGGVGGGMGGMIGGLGDKIMGKKAAKVVTQIALSVKGDCAELSMKGSAACTKAGTTAYCAEHEILHTTAKKVCNDQEGCKWAGDAHADLKKMEKPVHKFNKHDANKNNDDKIKVEKATVIWQALLDKQACIKEPEKSKTEKILDTPIYNKAGAAEAKAAAAKAAAAGGTVTEQNRNFIKIMNGETPTAPVAAVAAPAVDACTQWSMKASKACQANVACDKTDHYEKNKAGRNLPVPAGTRSAILKTNCENKVMTPSVRQGCQWVEEGGPMGPSWCKSAPAAALTAKQKCANEGGTWANVEYDDTFENVIAKAHCKNAKKAL